MPIEFRCVNCQKLLRVVDEAVGKKARCPDCGTIQEARPSAGIGLDSPSFPPVSAPSYSSGSTPVPPASPSLNSAANPFADQAPANSPFGQTATNPYQSPQVSSAAALLSREAALAKVHAPATGLLVVAGILIAGHSRGLLREPAQELAYLGEHGLCDPSDDDFAAVKEYGLRISNSLSNPSQSNSPQRQEHEKQP